MFNTCIKILLNEEKYTDATQINLGQSRIGGSIIDYPKSETIADNLYLLAQLNLSDIKSSEFKDLLPASGFLYFLVEDDYLEGCVKYFDVPVEQLVRLHHQNEAYEIGRKITGFADQFLPDEDEDAYEEWRDTIKVQYQNVRKYT